MRRLAIAAMAIGLAGCAGYGYHPAPGPGYYGYGHKGYGHHGYMQPANAPDAAPGWALMSPAERRTHRERLLAFRDAGECHAYLERHRLELAERARARGLEPPPAVPGACGNARPR